PGDPWRYARIRELEPGPAPAFRGFAHSVVPRPPGHESRLTLNRHLAACEHFATFSRILPGASALALSREVGALIGLQPTWRGSSSRLLRAGVKTMSERRERECWSHAVAGDETASCLSGLPRGEASSFNDRWFSSKFSFYCLDSVRNTGSIFRIFSVV